MKLAVKEANEALFWLSICERSDTYPECGFLISSTEELIRILSKIIISSISKLSG